MTARSRVAVLVLACAPALAFLLALRPVTDFDLGFHLRTGELVMAQGIPLVDHFAFPLDGKPWAPEQWLGATALYLVWARAGVAGVIVVKALAVAATFALVALAAARLAGPVAGSLAALLAASVASGRFNAQPFVFSFLLLATVVWILTRAPSGRRALLLLPLFALWPQVHPGWLYGLACLGAFAGGAVVEAALVRWGRASRLHVRGGAAPLVALLLGCAASAVASLLLFHPAGKDVLLRVWHVFSSKLYQQNIVELQPLWRSYGLDVPTVLLFGLPFAVAAARRRELSLTTLFPTALFVFSALRVGRLVSEAAIVAAPAFAGALLQAQVAIAGTGRIERLRSLLRPPRLALFTIAATAVALAASAAEGYGRNLDWLDSSYPRGCYAWIDAHDLPPRGFNDLWFGGTFIFHFFPRRQVFIDGRILFTDDFFEHDYLPLKNAEPGWKDIAARWGLRWFLLHPGRFARLHRALRQDKGFRLAHEEENCTIYVESGLR